MHGGIDLVVGERDKVERRDDLDIDVGFDAVKAGEALVEPARGKAGIDGQHKAAGLAGVGHASGACRDRVKGARYDGLQVGPRRRQCDAIARAAEQAKPKVVLEAADLPADGGVGNQQFLGREREALMPRGGLEGAQGGQARQSPRHCPA
ncbi:MAG: hypothetical protein WD673_14270 [Alphaproteobacteria bacterium]